MIQPEYVAGWLMIAALVAVALLLVAYAVRNPDVRVCEQLPLAAGRTPADLQAALVEVRGAKVEATAWGQVAVVQSRPHPLGLVLAIVAFPWGLIGLLFRNRRTLRVEVGNIDPADPASALVVRMYGESERVVVQRVKHQIAPLLASAASETPVQAS